MTAGERYDHLHLKVCRSHIALFMLNFRHNPRQATDITRCVICPFACLRVCPSELKRFSGSILGSSLGLALSTEAEGFGGT